MQVVPEQQPVQLVESHVLQTPFVHVPEHGAQAAPPVPHIELFCWFTGTQVPLLQHPAQLLHVAWHVPPWHVSFP